MGVTEIRVATGNYLFADTGGDDPQWYYATPDLAFHVIHGPADVIGTLATKLGVGAVDLDAVTCTERELVMALLARGVLEEVAPAPASSFSVLVDVEDDVCAQVGALLSAAGVEVVRGDAADHPLDGIDAAVVTSSHQRDQAWVALDRRFREADIAWHRAYFEGDALVIGPLSVPGQTAGYADCRGRQLAASRTANELTVLWRHLDTAPGVVRADPAAVAAQAVAAGLMVADIVAIAAGAPSADAGAQRVHHLVSASTTVHRVLPLPDLAVR